MALTLATASVTIGWKVSKIRLDIIPLQTLCKNGLMFFASCQLY